MRINFPEGLEKIGVCAFEKTKLRDAELPASLRTLSQGAFTGCKSLKTVKFNEGLETLGTNERTDDGELWCGAF